MGRLRGVEGGPGPSRGGAGRGGARAAGVGGRPGGHGDGPVRGGRTGRRGSAAGAGRAWSPAFLRLLDERPASGRYAARPCWRCDDAGDGGPRRARPGWGRVPEELSARVPAEQRGPGRAGTPYGCWCRGARRCRTTRSGSCPAAAGRGPAGRQHLCRRWPAAVDGRIGHARVVVHFSTRGDDGRWAVELRDPDGTGTTRARAGGPAGGGGAAARGCAAGRWRSR